MLLSQNRSTQCFAGPDRVCDMDCKYEGAMSRAKNGIHIADTLHLQHRTYPLQNSLTSNGEPSSSQITRTKMLSSKSNSVKKMKNCLET